MATGAASPLSPILRIDLQQREIHTRLGLNMGSSRRRHLTEPGAVRTPGDEIPLDIRLVQEAERLGYHVAWSAEAYGSDAIVPLAWVGALTSTIHLGTAIMQIPGHTSPNDVANRVQELYLAGHQPVQTLNIRTPTVEVLRLMAELVL